MSITKDFEKRVPAIGIGYSTQDVKELLAYTRKLEEEKRVNQECCYVLYWTRQNGEVEFALDIDKNVQLYDEERSAREANNRTCFRKKVGFRFVQS